MFLQQVIETFCIDVIPNSKLLMRGSKVLHALWKMMDSARLILFSLCDTESTEYHCCVNN